MRTLIIIFSSFIFCHLAAEDLKGYLKASGGYESVGLGVGVRTFTDDMGLDASLSGYLLDSDLGGSFKALPLYRVDSVYMGIGFGANFFKNKNLNYRGPIKEPATTVSVVDPKIQGTMEFLLGTSWQWEGLPESFLQLSIGKGIFKGSIPAPFSKDWTVKLEYGMFVF